MTTSKAIIITALLLFTSIGFAQTNVQPLQEKPTICKEVLIALQEAIQNHGLFMEMLRQLKPDFLNQDQYAYWARVSYKGNVYCIKGSYHGWRHFFETNLVIGKKR